MSSYIGDFAEDATLHFLWSSNDADGASITRATDGTISVYKDNGTTQTTAGITDTEDFDSLTGIHACTIDLSADAFYATGANYSVVLSAATIDGQTVNAVLREFSIENRTAFPKADYPTNFTALGIESDGDVTKVNTLDGHTAQTGDNFARIGAAGASLTDLGGMSTAMKAEVNAEADTALTDYDPPTKTEMDAGFAALNDVSSADVNAACDTALSDYDGPTDAEMVAAFTEIKGATWASGTDTLEHIRDKQTDIEADTQDLQTQIGTAGAGLSDLGGMSTGMKGEVNAEADTALTDYDPPTRTEATSDKDEILALLPAALVGGRMDSSIGSKASGVGLSTQEAADVNAEVDSALDTAIPGSPTADSINERIKAIDELTESGGGGDLAAMDANVDAIKVITDALTAAAAAKQAAAALGIITGTVDTTAFTATTTVLEADDITEATDDHFNGRHIIFTSGILLGQETDITDYTLNGGRARFTYTALTDAPTDNMTFVIV